MSHPGQNTPLSSNLSESYPVASLTLVVLLLIPAVVVLLLLNCLFLGYKLIVLFKARPRPQNREDADEILLLESMLQRARTTPDAEGFSTRRPYMSLSEPVLPQPPVTSSRASSSGKEHGIWLPRGSLRVSSSIRAAGASSRLARPSVAEWCHSAPVLLQSSESEADDRGNLVPPNSPTCVYKEAECEAGIRRCSTYGMLTELSPGELHPLDQTHVECPSYTHPLSEGSCPNTSALSFGLDSDFGASAGVSLRILSADSDGLSNGVLASALEWDYYDPCYVNQNHVPKHKHHRPAMHTKQYWV
ncbi:protein huluwa isoform X2 [Hippocampus zosterae]|uniref:protein huluwa isoform X2 n=1 Tax=Hippocampus zosterae TaxID=109293 RepID=UPI00223D6FB2|nr:protein huluwa isoform X2 [Hippocampus zosterae]